MPDRPTPEQVATWLRDPTVHRVAVPSSQTFCGTLIYQHESLRELAADALDSIRKERDALASWSCAECGARFGIPIPKPPMMHGVTRCSKCAESEALREQVATLTKERDEAQDRLILSEARQLKANDERDAALADAGVLAAGLSMFVSGRVRVVIAEERHRIYSGTRADIQTVTDATAALSRHGGGAC